jgi:hypothetical protein
MSCRRERSGSTGTRCVMTVRIPRKTATFGAVAGSLQQCSGSPHADEAQGEKVSRTKYLANRGALWQRWQHFL